MRIGADGNAFGPLGATIADQARRAEAAGFDSLWLGDHIISPVSAESTYPNTCDGSIPWSPETEMYDAIISATVAAASTTRLDIALGVLVLPLREPIVVAKQLATLDRLSNGRLILGCGAGWLAEEFAALHVPFDSRQERLAEWIDLLRACWTGYPGLVAGEHYDLAIETACFPIPAGPLPILVGGVSQVALDLAGRKADGWYPIVTADRLKTSWLEPRLDRVREAAADSGRQQESLRFVLYADAPLPQIAAQLPELEALGVSEVVVFLDWQDDEAPARTIDALRR
jgi:probable F420-dependent oxidoreductase